MSESTHLYERFVEGLRKKHNMTPEDLADWWLAYNIPDCSLHNCVCGQPIKHLFFITNGTRELIIGCVCKDNFAGENCKGVICINCKTKFRNKFTFLCKDCQICRTCCKPIYNLYNCSNTKHRRVPGKCITCKKSCPKISLYCFDCSDLYLCKTCYNPLHIYLTTCSNEKHKPVPGKCIACINACPMDQSLCLQCSDYKYACRDCGKYANSEFCNDCIVAMGFFDP